MLKDADYSINKAVNNGLTEVQLNTCRTFYTNMLETYSLPITTPDAVNYIATLGMAIMYTYPTLNTATHRYYTGQIRVKKYSRFLASFVSLRNALNHPTERCKVELALRCFLQNSNDPNLLDNVPINLKKHIKLIMDLDFSMIVNYIAALFCDSAKAKSYLDVNPYSKDKSKIVNRITGKNYTKKEIQTARSLAPIAWRNAPDEQFVLYMGESAMSLANLK